MNSINQHISPKLNCAQFGDIEAQAAGVPGPERSVYSQLTRGRFEGVVQSYVISPRVSFVVEKTNRSIRKQFAVDASHLRIGFLCEQANRFACCGNGVRLQGAEASINFPETAIDLHLGENYQGCWVSLDYRAISQLLNRNGELSVARRSGRLQVAGPVGALFRNAVMTARNELFGPGSPTPHPRIVAAFEKTLISCAAYTLSSAQICDAGQKRASARHRAHLLRKACELIDAKTSEGLMISELCLSVGTSRRNLEMIFAEGLNVSPYQYIQAVRLNAIRKALLSDEDMTSSIGEIASRWGIWHLSRFANDYRMMFGELPSETRDLALQARVGPLHRSMP